MTEPLNPSPPIGTRLILASEGFLERIGTRTERGDKITAEWGEPDDRGWYTPIFTAHADDNLIAEATAHADAQASLARLRAEELERALRGLLNDVEPVDHSCEPTACPMAEARRVLEGETP